MSPTAPIAERRRLLSPYSNRHRIALEKLFRRMSQLSTLPVVAQRVLTAAADPEADVEALREIIQRDVALAATILRRANAAIYARCQKIADLRSAITVLGFREIRNVCLTVFVSRMFNRPGKYKGYSRENLWRHCVATAVAASKIARVTEKVSAEEAYMCGLLHHVGTILLDQHLREQFCRVIDHIDPETPTYLVERDLLSFDQGQMAAFVLSRWNFPQQIADSVRYYRYPDLYDGPHPLLVHATTLANFLCSRAGWTSLGVENTEPPSEETYALLDIEPTLADLLWEGLAPSLDEEFPC